MMLSRRGVLGVLLAAPVVIRTQGLLMPIKPLLPDHVWRSKTPGEILEDVNSMLIHAWANTGYSVVPDQFIVSPDTMKWATRDPVVAQYIQYHSVSFAARGKPLQLLTDYTMPTGMLCKHSEYDSTKWPETVAAQSLAEET